MTLLQLVKLLVAPQISEICVYGKPRGNKA